jgi:hypothetical protein
MKPITSKTCRHGGAAGVSAFGMLAVLLIGGSAQALTMQECSAKYRSAKAASALNGMNWNDFRKSQIRLFITTIFPPHTMASARL